MRTHKSANTQCLQYFTKIQNNGHSFTSSQPRRLISLASW